MKPRNLMGLCIVLALSVLLHSCSSADKNALPVPKDAAFVLHLNTKSLNSKLSWEEIKKSTWFNEAEGKATDSLARQLLNDPESSGIETKDEIVFFVKRTNSNEGFFVVSGRVKDAAKFEAFNKNISEGKNAAAAKEGDITSMSLNKKVLVSWSGDKFLYVIDGNTGGAPWGSNFPQSGMDSLTVDSSGNPVMPDMDRYEGKPADLKGYTASLYKLPADSMLINDSRYKDLLGKDGDMHFWMSAEHAYGAGVPMGMMSMLKLEKYFKESVTAASLSFENGKIVMNARSYSNDEMNNLAKKYAGKDINTNFLERIPSDSVAAVLILNYKPEGLKEFLKIGGLDGMANSGLAEMGITLDDFITANGGDLLLAVTDFQIKPYTISLGEGTEPYTGTKPDAQVLFATSVGNKAAMDKLIGVGKNFGQRMRTDTSIFYNLTNDLFALGTQQALVDQFVKGGNRKHAFGDKLKGHPLGMYIDLQKFIRVFGSVAKDSSAMALTNASLAMWQDIVVTGGEFNDGAVNQLVEVNLVDKNTNSLKQLNQYADKMAAAGKQRGF